MGRRFWRVGKALGFAFVVLNILVWRHAWRFTHFVEGAERTPGPEALSLAARLWVLVDGVQVSRPVLDRRPGDAGLNLADVSVAGVSTWVGEGTRAATVVLFHGYGSSKADLLDEAAFFAGEGLGVVLVDFPGSGDSPGSTTTLGFGEAGVVSAVYAFCRAKAPENAVILYGKSMGSAAILRAVSQGEISASALILENPFDRLLTTVGHRFASMGLPAFPGAPLLVFWGGVQLGFNGFQHNPVEYAQHISAPTLLLTGANDPRVYPEEVASIAAALAGPNELVVVPGAGHVGLLHAAPELWKEEVRGFLSER